MRSPLLLCAAVILPQSVTPVAAFYIPFLSSFFPTDKDPLATARGPCPGLNALANHGYINRTGRYINFNEAINGCFLGLGTTHEVCGLSAHNVINLDPKDAYFDLEHLSRHKMPIEHDVSLSREDIALGNNNVFNPKIWASTMVELSKSNYVTAESLGKARARRVDEQRRKNPKLDYDDMAAELGGVEAAMLLTSLGAGYDHKPKLAWVRCLFEQERLPTHLGWRPFPASNNLLTTIGVATNALKAQYNVPFKLKEKLYGPVTGQKQYLDAVGKIDSEIHGNYA
ncbi:hypothetical protein CP533_1749 [Ophiocordyceps camponoti-saundersi (nom. inval.)]|nr:hypothetical protein CP533_1749 [Ophiocordyceps camponoti-saundersi (nom. inval.)]